jgi:hypothetical protein
VKKEDAISSLVDVVAGALVARINSTPRGRDEFLGAFTRALIAPIRPTTQQAAPAHPRRGRPPTKSAASGRSVPKGRAEPRCSACGEIGHRKGYKICTKRPGRERRTAPAPKRPTPAADDEDAPAASAQPAPDSPAPETVALRIAAPSRQCSPYRRARTIAEPKGKKLQDMLQAAPAIDVQLDRLRPRTRADCATAPRPCPFVSCKHHLALEVHPERGSLRQVFPDFNIADDPAEGLQRMQKELGATCVLDVIGGHEVEHFGGLIALHQAALSLGNPGHTPGLNIEETGRRMNLSIERTRQISSAAMQELRVKLLRIFGSEFTQPMKRRQQVGADERSERNDFHKLVTQRLREKFGAQEERRQTWNSARRRSSAPEGPEQTPPERGAAQEKSTGAASSTDEQALPLQQATS